MFICRLLLLCVISYVPLFFNGADPSYQRVMFVGNSITKHGPAHEIGWYGDYGMAATSEDKDWVHVVLQGIENKNSINADSTPEFRIISSDLPWTWTFTSIENTVNEFNPELVIIQVGDNADRTTDYITLDNQMQSIINAVYRSDRKIILVGKWGVDDVVNSIIKTKAVEYGFEYVQIHDLNNNDNNARSNTTPCTNDAVCWHPGDNGMRLIAERILNAIYK